MDHFWKNDAQNDQVEKLVNLQPQCCLKLKGILTVYFPMLVAIKMTFEVVVSNFMRHYQNV
jgi:hypothetical protein